MIAKYIGPFKDLYLNHTVLLVDYLLQMLKPLQQIALSFILYFSFKCLTNPSLKSILLVLRQDFLVMCR